MSGAPKPCGWAVKQIRPPAFPGLSAGIAVIVLFVTVPLTAAERSREETLLDAYRQNVPVFERSDFGFPLHLESSDHEGRLHVDVYGVFMHTYERILEVVISPATWCEIASLHPNVKACTVAERPGERLLTFYISRRVKQSADDAYLFINHFRIAERHDGYVDILLRAPEGPFGTKDHRMRFEAIPLGAGRTLVHVSYTYDSGFPANIAGKIYFATLGRNKVGFTVTGTDRSGAPVYVGGQRGAIERNAVRYYFAILAYMDSLSRPEAERFMSRLQEWHDLTGRFRRQLAELDKKEYIEIKTEERRHLTGRQSGPAAGAH